MSDEMPREEMLAVIDQMVEELLEQAGVAAPPVDVIALAQRHLGMVIVLDKRQMQRGRAQRTFGQKQIYLRPEPSEERHQWTVAHEVGEHLKVELLQRLGQEPDQTRGMTGESLANLFATHLLVPTCWFAGDARSSEYDLIALKRRYSTSSNEVLAWRFLDLPDPCIVTIVDNDHIRRRRSNGVRVKKELSSVEAKCQQHVNHYGRPTVMRGDGWTVQGWPVHGPDWKREILRSVVDEDS